MSGEHHHDHDGEHDHHQERGWRHAFSPEAWRMTIANFRGSELPWYKTLAVASINYGRKIRGGQECCGNTGHPGC